jgi:hypothetical protein
MVPQNLDTLPPDILRKIAMDLRPYEILEFCLVASPLNNSVCDSHDFWVEKLRLDFPYVIDFFTRNNLRLYNPKNTYSRYYLEITLGIENITNTYIHKILTEDNLNISFVNDSKFFMNNFNGNINKLLLDAYLDLIELVYIIQDRYQGKEYEFNEFYNYEYKNLIKNIYEFDGDNNDIVYNPIILDYIYTIIEKYNGTEEWALPLYHLIYTALIDIKIPYIRIKPYENKIKRTKNN